MTRICSLCTEDVGRDPLIDGFCLLCYVAIRHDREEVEDALDRAEGIDRGGLTPEEVSR